jgi:hypothetical protein
MLGAMAPPTKHFYVARSLLAERLIVQVVELKLFVRTVKPTALAAVLSASELAIFVTAPSPTIASTPHDSAKFAVALRGHRQNPGRKQSPLKPWTFARPADR